MLMATVTKIPATDTLGTRMKVIFATGQHVFVGYDHAASDPYRAAVWDAFERLFDKRPSVVWRRDGSEYIYEVQSHG